MLFLSVHPAQASSITAEPSHRPRIQHDARFSQCSSRGIDIDVFSTYFLL